MKNSPFQPWPIWIERNLPGNLPTLVENSSNIRCYPLPNEWMHSYSLWTEHLNYEGTRNGETREGEGEEETKREHTLSVCVDGSEIATKRNLT